jgi:HEPN domain-containing protein
MNTNFSQGKSWIISAISDVKIVITGIQNEYYSLVAFRSQFAVEKFNKAILSFMGLKIEKTHTPTDILEDIISSKSSLIIDVETKKVLEKILKFSKFFENEGVQTRYGTIKNNKLVIAEEIYQSFEDIKSFLINLQNIVNCFLKLVKESLNITEKEFENLLQLESLLGELKQWI